MTGPYRLRKNSCFPWKPGGSPLLQQGGATLQRRGKSRTSINRALAPVRMIDVEAFLLKFLPIPA
jgi:hypothetical protein